MADTTVIIFFVGLTMFSSGIPNDSGWKAVLPRVVYVDPFTPIDGATQLHQIHAQLQPAPVPPPAPDARRTPVPAAAATATAARLGPGTTNAQLFLSPFSPQPHVEDHQSVLIFPNTAWHSSSNWTRKTLTTDPSFSYVELDGDQVRFVTQPPPPPPGQQLSLDASKLILPPLATLCPNMIPLRKEYLPPYQGAAAVFDLAAEGALSSCLSTKGNHERLDSKLELKTTGRFFVVSASTMKTTKEVRLDLSKAGGTVNIYVGNIPKRYLAGKFTPVPSTQIDGMSHVHAYYNMGIQTATCTQPLKTWYDAYKNDPTKPVILACGTTFIGLGKNSTPVPTPIPGEIPPGVISALGPVAMTFECSNTQWP